MRFKKNQSFSLFPLDKPFKLCYNKITKDKEIVAHYEVWEKVSKKMTQREFFNAVINGQINDEVIAHANEEIAKLDTRNAKKSEKTANAHAEEKAQIMSVLTDTVQLASEIAEKVGMSTAKVSGLLGRMDGITVTEVKVKGGKRKGYTLA